MPKLSEIKTEGALKILIFGNAGTGKTCFAASMPGPILYLDFDGKVDSAAMFYAGNKALLDGVDVRELAQGVCKHPMQELESIFNKELEGKEFPYKTIVLDSLTTFSSLALKYIVDTNPGVKRVESRQGKQPCMQDFGILKRYFAGLIPQLLGLPCNVIMLGHISTVKDDLTGQIVRGPLMDGSFAQQLPIYFKEVWHSYVEKGKYLVQTQADYKFDCRSQLKGLPNPCELSYAEIKKHL